MKNKIRLLALAMASLIAVGSAVPQTAAGAAVKTDSASGTAAKPASSSSFMDITYDKDGIVKGKFGKGFTFTYNKETGQMNIYGKGKIVSAKKDDNIFLAGFDNEKVRQSFFYYNDYADCYDDNTKISSIVFHDGITEIGDNAFFGCKSLKEVTLPDSVTKIGRDAFHYDEKLSSIRWSRNLKYIGAYAFAECGFKKISIPDSVRELGGETFSDNKDLVDVTVGRGCAKFGGGEFINCDKLKTLKFNCPKKVKASYKIVKKGKKYRIYKYAGKKRQSLIRNKVVRIGKKYYYADKKGYTVNKVKAVKVGKSIYLATRHGYVYTNKTVKVGSRKYKTGKDGRVKWVGIEKKYYYADKKHYYTVWTYLYPKLFPDHFKSLIKILKL